MNHSTPILSKAPPPPVKARFSTGRLLLHLLVLLPIPLIGWLMITHMKPYSLDKVRRSEMILIGHALYDRGQGNEALAIWLPILEEENNAQLQVLAGHILLKGMKVPKRPDLAVHWYRKAANQGEMHAMYHLGVQLIKGEGVEKDLHGGLEWIRKSAEKGMPNAMLEYALLHYTGAGFVTQDDKTAFYWASKLAERNHPLGTSVLGMLYLQGRGTPPNTPKAISLFERAADAGSLEAMGNLGALYYNGAAGVPTDPRRAFRHFKRAAAKKHPQSLYMAGFMLINGQGVAPDSKRGVELLKKAAALGSEKAAGLLEELGASR
ncbi:MAG: sel1 repeat family protein [Magnetococcales bacterium]|nr:sel1 repeat family protein [Magnetococcales bacterium]